jgi:hypothetical protein
MWEAEIRRTTVWGQPGHKVSETPMSTNKSCAVVQICNSNNIGCIGRRIKIWIHTQPKNERPYLKNNKSKKVLRVHLLSKHKALNSNPTTMNVTHMYGNIKTKSICTIIYTNKKKTLKIKKYSNSVGLSWGFIRSKWCHSCSSAAHTMSCKVSWACLLKVCRVHWR